MLKKFDVSYNGFDMEGGKVLAEVVRHNSTIEKLNISSTRLNAECAASIANAIEHNDSLKILNVIIFKDKNDLNIEIMKI